MVSLVAKYLLDLLMFTTAVVMGIYGCVHFSEDIFTNSLIIAFGVNGSICTVLMARAFYREDKSREHAEDGS